jgi:hypothetical protein
MITKSKLIDILSNQIVQIKFKKKDQTERIMNCTLREDIVKPYVKKTEKTKIPANENVLPVWDLEKNAFRSFRIDSLTDYSIVREGYEL